MSDIVSKIVDKTYWFSTITAIPFTQHLNLQGRKHKDNYKGSDI